MVVFFHIHSLPIIKVNTVNVLTEVSVLSWMNPWHYCEWSQQCAIQNTRALRMIIVPEFTVGYSHHPPTAIWKSNRVWYLLPFHHPTTRCHQNLHLFLVHLHLCPPFCNYLDLTPSPVSIHFLPSLHIWQIQWVRGLQFFCLLYLAKLLLLVIACLSINFLSGLELCLWIAPSFKPFICCLYHCLFLDFPSC